MIATSLFGGLGNQMFIYAMVRAMSLRNETYMAFNTRQGFAMDFTYKRFLELNHFNISLPKSTFVTFDFRSIYISRLSRKISQKVGRNIFLPNYIMLNENQKEFHFESIIKENKCKNIFLDGYWQSPQYFSDYEDIIRSDFRIKTEIPDEVLAELDCWKLYGRPIVMIGVRRYQECPNGEALCDTCQPQYYNNAIAYVKNHINNPLFVVFSQDHDWCKRNLTVCDYIFAKEKTGLNSAIYDMFLMSNCNHAIISNSSFYWWGAWLQSSQNNHIVIAPDNFLNKDSACENWIVLPAK